MNYLKYTSFVYLLAAGFFLYDAYERHQEGRSFWLSIILSVVAVFLFFFRRHFARKMEQRNRPQS